MDKKDIRVTIHHKEGYALGGISLGMTALVLLLALTSEGSWLLGLVIGGAGLLISAFGFVKAGTVEILEEEGITVQTPFRVAKYPWDKVKRVELQPPGGKDTPKLWLFIQGRRMPLRVEYTKRSYRCIVCCYGEPNADHWGKPPVIT